MTQSEEIRERLQHSMTMLLGHPNIMGTQAALAAYRDGQALADEVLVYLEANRDYLVDFVHSELPGVAIWQPEGTYLAWLGLPGTGARPSHRTSSFWRRRKVGLNEGADFGAEGEGFVRLNFACPRALLVEGLERMKICPGKTLGHKACSNLTIKQEIGSLTATRLFFFEDYAIFLCFNERI